MAQCHLAERFLSGPVGIQLSGAASLQAAELSAELTLLTGSAKYPGHRRHEHKALLSPGTQAISCISISKNREKVMSLRS